MALLSMTGFARNSINIENRTIVWELKSVNGRSLDMRFRLPTGFDRLEPQLRTILQSRFKRGTIAVSLVSADQPQTQTLAIDRAALAAALSFRAELIAQNIQLAPSTLEGLLSIRGIIRDEKHGLSDSHAFDAALLSAFHKAVGDLLAARRTEGAAIAGVIETQLGRIESLTKAAKADPSLQPQFISDKIRMQLDQLLATHTGFDPQRLHMEAVLLATKADISEETDRLLMHAANARQLIKAGDAAGRKLDFLSQEFNREANTLCAKANAATLTDIGVNLKVVIDQFREQIQNLE